MLPPPDFWIYGINFSGITAINRIQFNANMDLEPELEMFKVIYPDGLGGTATGALSFRDHPGVEHRVRHMFDNPDYYLDFIITLTDDGGISFVIEHNFYPSSDIGLPATLNYTVYITREGISAPLVIALVFNMPDRRLGSYSTTDSYGINLTGIGGEGIVGVLDDIDVDNIAVDMVATDESDPTSNTNRIIPDEEIDALLRCTDEEIPSGTRFYAVFERKYPCEPCDPCDNDELPCSDCGYHPDDCTCDDYGTVKDEDPVTGDNGTVGDTRAQVSAPRTGDNTSTLPLMVGTLFSMSAVFGGMSLKRRLK
jgi:hypothetical protein